MTVENSSSKKTPICRYDPSHINYISHSVMCVYCQRPLFLVRWWYHAIILNLSLFFLGVLIGEFGDKVWPAFLVLELFLFTYLLVLFRHEPMLQVVSLLFSLVTCLQIFVSNFGDFGFVSLSYFRTLVFYLTAITALLFYVVMWGAEVDDSEVGYLKALSALSLGLFVIGACTEQIDRIIVFLPGSFRHLLHNHLYARTLLLAVTVIHLLSYTAAKSLKNEISVPRYSLTLKDNFLRPIKSKKPSSSIEHLMEIMKGSLNVLLAFIKALLETAVAILNFLIRVLLIIFFRVKDYCGELLKTIGAVLLVLVKSLKDYGRLVILPLLVCYGLSTVLLTFGGLISNNIWGGLDAAGWLWLIISIAGLNLGFILLAWLLSEDKFIASTSSVILSNVSISLLLILYTSIASLELWLLAQWRSTLPYDTIGIFTLVTVVIIVLTSAVLLTATVVRDRK